MKVTIGIQFSNLKDDPETLTRGSAMAWSEAKSVPDSALALPLDEFVRRYIEPLAEQARRKFIELTEQPAPDPEKPSAAVAKPPAVPPAD